MYSQMSRIHRLLREWGPALLRDSENEPYVSIPSGHNEAIEIVLTEQSNFPFAIVYFKWDMTGGVVNDDELLYTRSVITAASFTDSILRYNRETEDAFIAMMDATMEGM